MKKRAILLMTAVLLLIAAAFLAPPLALRAAVSDTLRETRQTDASAYRLDEADQLIEKLQTAGDSQTVYVRLPDTEPKQALLARVRQELEELKGLGAISTDFCSFFSAAQDETVPEESYTTERVCVIRSDLQLTFEAELLYLMDEETNVILDQESGKILALQSVSFDPERFYREYGGDSGDRTLQGWAAYYDLTLEERTEISLTPEEIGHVSNPNGKYRETELRRARLSDAASRTVSFGLQYVFDGMVSERYLWGALE